MKNIRETSETAHKQFPKKPPINVKNSMTKVKNSQKNEKSQIVVEKIAKKSNIVGKRQMQPKKL